MMRNSAHDAHYTSVIAQRTKEIRTEAVYWTLSLLFLVPALAEILTAEVEGKTVAEFVAHTEAGDWAKYPYGLVGLIGSFVFAVFALRRGPHTDWARRDRQIVQDYMNQG